MPFIEGHNTWCVNVPGSTLIWSVADVAQHILFLLLYLIQNGTGIYDDVNGRQIPGLEKYGQRLNMDVVYPMTFLEQVAMTDVATETGNCLLCRRAHAAGPGAGWLEVFRDQSLRRPWRLWRSCGSRSWLSYVTGRPGAFEAHVPPHHASMRAAVEAVVARKFGKAGPFDPGQSGPYRENARVRGSAAQIDAEAVEIATIMADYVCSTFGRFPATAPAVFVNTYLQAHRLDTGPMTPTPPPARTCGPMPSTTATGVEPQVSPALKVCPSLKGGPLSKIR